MLEERDRPDYSLESTEQLRLMQSDLREELSGLNLELSRRELELAGRRGLGLGPLVTSDDSELKPWQRTKAGILRALVKLVSHPNQKTGPFRGQFWPFHSQGEDYVCPMGNSFMALTETVLMQACADKTYVEDVENRSSAEKVNLLSTRSFVGEVLPSRKNGAWVGCQVKYGIDGQSSLPARLKEIRLQTVNPNGEGSEADLINFVFNARSWLLRWGRPVESQKGWAQVSYSEAAQRLLDLRRFANTF